MMKQMNFEKAKINSLSTNFEVEEESTCDYNDIDSCYKDIEYGDKKLNEKVYYAGTYKTFNPC